MQSTAPVASARVQGNPRDVIGGVVAVAAGIALLVGTSHLPSFIDDTPGPGFFPRGLAIIWIVLGVLLTVTSLLRRVEPSRETPDAEQPGSLTRVVAVVAGLAGGAFLIGVIGLVLSIAVMTLYFAYVVERTRPVAAVVFAAALSIGIYLVFEMALDVPLPQGPFGF